MHPYAAKMLVSRVRGRSPADLERSIRALADLELWSRGGSDYREDVALTLALRRRRYHPTPAPRRRRWACRAAASGRSASAGLLRLCRARPWLRGPRPCSGRGGAAFLRAPVFLCIAPFWIALSTRGDQPLVLGVGGRIVAGGDGLLEPLHVRLHRAGEAQVLLALARGAGDSLLL